MSSNTRGCNHIQLNIDVRKQICHKCPGSQGRPTAATQLSPLTAATHAPHIPGAIIMMPVGIAVRDSKRKRGSRVSTGPVTKRCYTPVRPHGPPVGTNPSRTVGTGQEAHPAQGPSQVREVNSTSVERSTLGLPLCGAAVHASLAPAQPPPPAGLASDPACKL